MTESTVWMGDENAMKQLSASLMYRTPVCWRTDFTIDDIYVWYHSGATISSILKYDFGIERDNVTEPTYVNKDGKQYCVSDFWYYLRTATQDQVDISSYMYGYHRVGLIHRPYNWSRCLILWKDDFFRVAHPEEMDMDRMLFLYLGIFAKGFQNEGVGMIDGYQIADYKTFTQVATEKQRQDVDTIIKNRKGHLSIMSRMCLASTKGSIIQLFTKQYWSLKIEDFKQSLYEWLAGKGINIHLADDS